MDRLELEEEDLRLADEQRAIAARPASSRATFGQQTPTQVPASTADAARDGALDKAKKIVGILAAQSGEHPGIAWAAGVYRVAGQILTVATSNEGMGYIPVGARWDQSVRLVFDPNVPWEETMPWQGLYDPARIVAGHFQHLYEFGRDTALLGIASTDRIGDATAHFLAEHGATMAERAAPNHSFTRQDGVRRVDPVLPGAFAGLIAPLQWWQRQQAALALLTDAAALADLPRAYPQLYEIVRGYEAGHGDWGWLQPVQDWARALTQEAQSRRVIEDRLGPVSTRPQAEATVLPQGGVFAYATPFYAARVCAMLSIMLRARAADERLSAESLADVVYEYYCVSENAESTRRIIGWGGNSGEQQAQGGWA